MLPRLLFSTPSGTVLEHPTLCAIARSGDDLLIPDEQPIVLPAHAKLVHLPNRRPIGFDPVTGKAEVLDIARSKGKSFVPDAVAAILPPGYTRTFLPAASNSGGAPLSQWAYTASGWKGKSAVVWAMRTDKRSHWEPNRFSTSEIGELVKARLQGNDENRVLRQLSRCALEYCCFTAQNIFYERDEGGLPSSTGCNAHCLGCISKSQEGGGVVSSMERLKEPPSAEEIAEVGGHHLEKAQGRVMVSFGQGCEGEPLTRAPTLVKAVELMRRRTSRGSININTNASKTEALEQLFDAGLDALRVSLNSAHPDLYSAYYRPEGYDFSDVERSLVAASRKRVYLALNLLIMPGVTDRAGEVEELAKLIERYKVNQLQTRSLCIDMDQYISLAQNRGAGGEPMGVRHMINFLKRRVPWLVIGNFARSLEER